VRSQPLTELRDVVLHGVRRRRRRLGSPQVVDERVRRDHLVGLQEEDRQQRALPWAAQRDRLTFRDNLEGSENPELDFGQVEIIFFSTPTPAETARSYSSGTVAESCSAMPVESKTVTWSSEIRPSESATLISPTSRHWRMSSTKTRPRRRMRGSSSCSPFRSAPSAARGAPGFPQAPSTGERRAG